MDIKFLYTLESYYPKRDVSFGRFGFSVRLDYDFAKKYGLEIREVIIGGNISKDAFVDYGVLIKSGQFNGLSSREAIEKITQWLEKRV